jgi:hypothetical protein
VKWATSWEQTFDAKFLNRFNDFLAACRADAPAVTRRAA